MWNRSMRKKTKRLRFRLITGGGEIQDEEDEEVKSVNDHINNIS